VSVYNQVLYLRTLLVSRSYGIEIHTVNVTALTYSTGLNHLSFYHEYRDSRYSKT